MRKLIVFTAPSGAGKTTIVRHLIENFDQLAFSVSATTRKKRKNEKHGEDYYFISPREFKKKVEEAAFLEWEEVYDDQYYGTLKSELERLWKKGKCIIFDIEVKGATNIKKAYPDESLVVFVKPPSTEILLSRLKKRRTETEKSLKKRIERAKEELKYENKFDVILVNDILEDALKDAEHILQNYLGIEKSNTHHGDNDHQRSKN